MTNAQLFKIKQAVIDKYSDKKPPFGAIGAPTYQRTYSRNVEDANGNVTAKEDFLQTIVRVIEGNVQLGIENGDPTATEEWAEEALDYFFHMGVMPPGRGYWMMGTEYARKRGGDALNNCWYVAVRPQSYENMEMFRNQDYFYSDPNKEMASYPFVFMFDRAMLGGGVGFGAQRRNVKLMPRVSSKTNLKIFLHENHPDWERIRASEEWDRVKEFLTSDPEGITKGNYYFATDDREGWNISVRETIDAHFVKTSLTKNENNLVIDLSRIRQYGAGIKGFGGTASGPLPLIAALVDANNILNARVGGKLKSVDALDIMNLLGRCVVAGNVRRTALIALGDHDEKEYVDAKNYTLVDPIMEKGPEGYTIWETNEWGRTTQRRKRFETVVDELYSQYTDDLEMAGIDPSTTDLDALRDKAIEDANELFTLAFKQENHRWASNNSVYTNELFKDHHFIAAGIIANGEPGIGNEYLMKNFGRIVDGFQEAIDKDAEGLNPCAEITLWNTEPCNLAEVVPVMCKRYGLSVEDALRIATQYTYRITFAKYMWASTARVIQQNRRIGISLTGMQDYYLEQYGHYALKGWEKDSEGNDDITAPIFHQEIVDELDRWYKIVTEVNTKHAIAIGANPSNKTTTVKPSGTVAKLPGVSSGMHWNYSPYLLQRIRFHETDPNLKVMEACGFHIEKAQKEPNTVVVTFPVKNAGAENPNFKGAGDVSLEEQFANQYLFALMWADNAVSATLTFQPHEVDKIEPLLAAYNNRIKSTSLLPYSGHGYVQAPWEPVSKEVYEESLKSVIANPEDIYHLFDLTLEADEDILDTDCVSGACPVR